MIRVIDEGRVKGNRNINITMVFIDSDSNVPGSNIILDADSLEVRIVDTVGVSSTMNGDSIRNIRGVAHSDGLMRMRCKEVLEGVGNVSGALNNVGRAEEGTEPINLGPGK